MHTQGATARVAMHFNEADSELLGGGVFKCGKYVGRSVFGTRATDSAPEKVGEGEEEGGGHKLRSTEN